MIRVVIVEDQKLLRESFKHIIENNSDIMVSGCAADGKEALDIIKCIRPDVVLMDLSMPVFGGSEATRLIKEKYPDIKVLILTSSDDKEDVACAISNGADGYILKSIGTEELILAIKSTWHGMEIIHKDVFRPSSINTADNGINSRVNRQISIDGIIVSFSDRELSIIEMIVDGKSNKEIGQSLHLAEGTVKNTITEIISKLQLKDRTQLAVFALKNNLI